MFHRTALSYAAGTVTALIGLLVLIGWQFDIAILKTSLLSGIVMKANTAAAVLLAGLALIFLQRSSPIANALVRFCALFVLLVGLLTLCEYAFGWNAGIDQILFPEPGAPPATSHPGRMAPNTALIFLLLGFAFFGLTYQRFRGSLLVEFPLVFSLIISVIGLAGYVSGLLELTGPSAYTQIAANTAGTFIILCAGMLATACEQQRAPITIEQKLFAGLTSAAAVIAFISFLSVSGFKSVIQTGEWVARSQELKHQLDLVLSHVVDLETGSRGFLLTGEEAYTEPLEAASRELPGMLGDLRLRTGESTRQREALSLLERLVTERIEVAEQLVQTRRSKGPREAVSLFATGRGKLLTDRIRVLVAHMITEEDRLLQTRKYEETQQARRTQVVIYFSLAAQVFLLMFTFVIVSRDVTGRRKAEESIRRANAELEVANQELEAFSYSVSHDLRAPLRSIDGFSQALLKDYNERLDEEGKDFLGRVRAASHRMARLIDDLLKLSRITRAEIRRERVDLSAIAWEIANELQKTQPERRVEFVIADSLIDHGDPQLLRAVMENLLGNSWKYTGKNPAARIEFRATDHDSKPSYYVRDNGVGFDMAYADKLFGAFQRLHSAAEFEGTGIGLATVQRIIRRHGGRVWAEGRVNEGATFYFSL